MSTMYELYWYYMIEDLDKSTIRQVNARALCNILITSSRSYFCTININQLLSNGRQLWSKEWLKLNSYASRFLVRKHILEITAFCGIPIHLQYIPKIVFRLNMVAAKIVQFLEQTIKLERFQWVLKHVIRFARFV